MNYELQVSGFKFCLILLSVLLAQNLSATEISTIESFETKFKIKIIISDTFKSSYESVHFEEVETEAKRNHYINNILLPEFAKYPASYFENIGLKQIVLCKKLFVDIQQRAAAPDPYKNTLILALDSSYAKNYIIHVLHHEVHHITEFALWQDMFYVWRKWQRKNTKQFTYGTGGQFAYIDGNEMVDWYKINNPKIGFVNLYSTLGPEEDRCEIVALLMTEKENYLLKEFAKEDKYLRKKLNLISRILNKNFRFNVKKLYYEN